MTSRVAGTRYAGALVLVVVGLLAAGCGRVSGPSLPDLSGRDELRLVTTVGMVEDVAREVGGNRVSVRALMGPGVDPHLYKASEGDLRRLERADLILYAGHHLEAKMGDVLERIGERRRVSAVAERIPRGNLILTEAFGGEADPHVWFDVKLWEFAVSGVASALEHADPAHEGFYRANAARYRAELDELDAWVRRVVATVPSERRVLITAHDAFGYFGRAYGFEVVGLQGISTASEAGTKDVQRLAAMIADRRIPAIFVESSVAPRTIEAVQQAVRARGFDVEIGGSLFSDAMGAAGTPEGTYIGMVRHNVRTIVTALGGAGL
ncbi:MAG: metal ABC transporter solute-binding protein, Zn/Mn family [Gaiella sp.]